MLFLINDFYLFIVFNFVPQFQQKQGICEMAKRKKCDICGAGADFLSFLCGTFFCSEILAWGSPDTVRGGGGGGVSLFPASSLFQARRLNPPRGSLRKALQETNF